MIHTNTATKVIAGLVLLLITAACGLQQDQGTDQMAVPDSETTTKTFYIGPEQVDCEGSGPQKCLLVKENTDDEYSFFYSNIHGFEWEPGYEYEILVEVTQNENPPADSSSLRYDLVEIVSKQAVAAAPSISFLDGKWTFAELSVDGEAVRLPDGSKSFLLIDGTSVSGVSGCNNFSGTAAFDQGTVSFEPLASTRKACLEDVMAFETAFLNLLENAATYEVDGDTLEIGKADGTMKAVFTLVREQALFVAAEQADGVGVGPQKCLLVKENIEDDYSFFYDKIEGFEWEAGHEYELLVEVSQVSNPPADGSSLHYALVEIVSQTEVSGRE